MENYSIIVCEIIATEQRPITYGCYELLIHNQKDCSSCNMSRMGLNFSSKLNNFSKLFEDLGVEVPKTTKELVAVEKAANKGQLKTLGKEWF